VALSPFAIEAATWRQRPVRASSVGDWRPADSRVAAVSLSAHVPW
jgi:hypothetical protein